jgi:predicted nucleic acid-binding protein
MSSLTLKQVPEDLVERLRQDAEGERRSVNQHALWLLEREPGPLATRNLDDFRDFEGLRVENWLV